MSVDDRFLPFGSRNFRHMGGYAATGGRTTRADRLFRSGWFELADDGDRRRFAGLGIGQVFDMRSDPERERQPLVLPEGGPKLIPLPITSGSMGAYIDTVSKMDPADIDCRSAMTRMYGEMAQTGSIAFEGLLRGLADGEGGALIICATGKDRTGVGSALLLSALGVARPDVVADFMISADVYRGHEEEFARRHGYEKRTGHDLSLFRDVFTVHPDYLDAVSGGALATMVDTLITDEQRRRLADRFTR